MCFIFSYRTIRHSGHFKMWKLSVLLIVCLSLHVSLACVGLTIQNSSYLSDKFTNLLWSLSTAQDGWKIRFNKITNCDPKNVITIDTNFTTSINKKCEVSNTGCLTSLGFTAAKVKYTVSKNGIPVMNGEPDVCAELNKENREAVAKLELIGFPTHCPIPEVSACNGFLKSDPFTWSSRICMHLCRVVNALMRIKKSMSPSIRNIWHWLAARSMSKQTSLTIRYGFFYGSSSLSLLTCNNNVFVFVHILQGKSCINIEFEVYK